MLRIGFTDNYFSFMLLIMFSMYINTLNLYFNTRRSSVLIYNRHFKCFDYINNHIFKGLLLLTDEIKILL